MAQSPRELFLAECVRYLGTKEHPVNSNRGLRVDYWLDSVGSPLESPWCSAFVFQAGIQSVGRSNWPFVRSGRVQDLVDACKKDGRFTEDLSKAGPGDLVVLWYDQLNRFGHVAAIETVTKTVVTSIDGNSNADGSREGYAVVRKSRPITKRVAALLWPT
jgi:hypothetical protein